MKKTIIYTQLISSMVIWSLTFIWTRKLIDMQLTPVTIIFFRLTFATLFLLPFIVRFLNIKNIFKKDLKYFLLMAMLDPFIYFLLETNGLRFVSATIASLIIASIPIVLAILSNILLKERLYWFNYLGFVLAYVGIFILLYQPEGLFNVTVFGISLLIGAVISASFYTIIARNLLDRYSVFVVTSAKIIIGWIYFTIAFIFLNPKPSIQNIMRLEIIFLLFMLGIMGNLIAYLLFNKVMKQLGVARSSIFASFIPVFTAMFSYFLLDEQFCLQKITSIALILSGTLITQWKMFAQ